jgi:hypothetical protein
VVILTSLKSFFNGLKKKCFPSKDLIGLHPAPYIIYKKISLNFYFVDVNLTPLQPHHKIEKGKNK